MSFLFWASAIVVAYAFIGYAAWMLLLARLCPKPVIRGPIQPSVSILMAVHNGADPLSTKLKNLSALDYPKEKLELIVASDGSTDATGEILSLATGITAILCPRVGKAEALNRALTACNNEIVVFTDVRQRIEPDAIGELVSNFADETVGCVSGELMFSPATPAKQSGISAYWWLEKVIRKCESASGSVIGATGALYAVRRSLIPTLPKGTLLDDVYLPLHVIRQDKRVVFEPRARVWDDVSKCAGSEFRRKVRTLAGNIQMLELAPWTIRNRTVRFRFVSHKLTRLIVPWLLLGIFFSSWVLAGSTFYLTLAVLQSLLYGIGLAPTLLPAARRWPFATGAQVFCLMNVAAAVAPFIYVRHRDDPNQMWVGKKET